MSTRRIWLLALALLAALWAGASRAVADLAYNISVNTSSVSGTVGSVELQFNPIDFTSLAATATISNVSNGTAGTIDTPIGDASGDLGSTVTIQNGQGTNDFFQNYTYRSTLSFTLAF